MQYRQLGRSEIKVSAICLGTMTWGEQNTQEQGFAQMDYALDQGVTFWDTAEMYAVPPRKETYGRTEEIIGNWFKARGKRDKVVLATKVAGPDQRFSCARRQAAPQPHAYPGGHRRQPEAAADRLYRPLPA